MTFVSYAQNFEDVMLWRALGHVQGGFYIDAGANDPLVDSVTLSFYERGWHGINIEPMRQFHEQLAATRERDVNLQVALGERPGTLTFFDVPGTGLSTLDPAIAAMHRDAGRQVVDAPVQVVTLADVCREHVAGPIHFLKVDVEGFETAVLRGMDFSTWRPWVLLVEATRPQSRESSHTDWEPMVLAAGYTPAWFDGLNRFYVANEHRELLAAFQAPPNYFDGFQLRKGHHYSHPIAEFEHRVWLARVEAEEAKVAAARSAHDAGAARRHAEAMERHANTVEVRVQAAQQDAAAAHQRVAALLATQHDLQRDLHRALGEIEALRASRSWRVTRPLRWVTEQRAALAEQGLAERVRRAVRRLLGRAAPPAQAEPEPAPPPPPQQLDMTRAAREVHEDLLAAIAHPSPAKE